MTNLDPVRPNLEVLDALNRDPQLKPFGFYEPDDPDVLSKLFRIDT